MKTLLTIVVAAAALLAQPVQAAGAVKYGHQARGNNNSLGASLSAQKQRGYTKPAYGYQRAPYGYPTVGTLHPRVVNSRPYSSFTTTLYGGYTSGYTGITPGFSTSTYIPSFAYGYNTPGYHYDTGYYYNGWYTPSFGYLQGYRAGFSDGYGAGQYDNSWSQPRVRVGQ